MTEAVASKAADNAAPPALGHWRHQEKELEELLAIVADSLAFTPPLYPNSILGYNPLKWLPPHPNDSEFSAVNLKHLFRSAQYLVDVSVPAVPYQMPERLPGIGDAVFWRPTTVLFEPGIDYNPYSFPEEAWIFINGIATNEAVARINAEVLVSLFHRPLTIIQNATDSVGVDLFESVVGKAWRVHTEPAAKAYPFIHRALHDPEKKRVVVLCHSQGTIIMANVLRALIHDEYRERMQAVAQRASHSHLEREIRPLAELEHLAKLEVYTFANAATVMAHAPGVTSTTGKPVPFIENFANEFDVVARNGVLAPRKQKHGIFIDGGIYVKAGMWGHLLNVHYLFGMRDHLADPEKCANDYLLQEPESTGAARRPRLYDYYHGKTPDPY